MKRAADVEEGLIFRRLSRDSYDGEAERLLADLSDMEEFADKFAHRGKTVDSEQLGEGTLAEGDNGQQLPESDPVFAEDDNESEGGKEEGSGPTGTLSSGMAALARTASAKALRRSLSAPADSSSREKVHFPSLQT